MLFGVDADQVHLDVENASEPDAEGIVAVRAHQQVGEVPVLDGQLLIEVGSSHDRPLVHTVRGRVFPDQSVSTNPAISARDAREAAEDLSGGSVQGSPSLVVLPEGSGVLAWQVSVVATESRPEGTSLASGLYLIDATSGELRSIRPTTAHSRALPPLSLSTAEGQATRAPYVAPVMAAPEGKDVGVTGTGPFGTKYKARGLQTDQGVRLIDTTTPIYKSGTGQGGIYTFTAEDQPDDKVAFPGKPYIQRTGTTITDPDAIAAHALARVVIDAYATLFGRRSWDGRGGSTIATVNLGGKRWCSNAFFSWDMNPPQMVFGNPCPGAVTEETVPSTTAHEITHGVTATSSGLNYVGQSGALNESFSDYLGMVIANRYTRGDGAAYGADGCAAVKKLGSGCMVELDGGRFATRNLLNGATYEDYLYLLDLPYRSFLTDTDYNDEAGVHFNSAIWNNALWSIRTRLARMDGTSGNKSPMARAFDKAVYTALTRLTPDSGWSTRAPRWSGRSRRPSRPGRSRRSSCGWPASPSR